MNSSSDFDGGEWVDRDLLLSDGAYRIQPRRQSFHANSYETRWGLGRKGTIYKLVDQAGAPWALKVFHPQYAEFEGIANTIRLIAWGGLAGLRVCRRRFIDDAEATMAGARGLRWSVLMPWIDGTGWQDIVLTQQPLTPEVGLRLAHAVAHVLAGAEAQDLVHGDIAAPNVLILPEGSHSRIELIDVEDMYHPLFQRIPEETDGSDGYILAENLGRGTHNQFGDLFAGAILIVEMLIWHVDEVRRHAGEDSVFRQQELGTPCPKYELARVALREAYPGLEELLDQVWNAKALSGCPPMAEWKTRLADIAPWMTEPRGFYGAGMPAPVSAVPRQIRPVAALHKEELPDPSQSRPPVRDSGPNEPPKLGGVVRGWRRLDDPD